MSNTLYVDKKLEKLNIIIELIKDENLEQLKKWGVQQHTIFEWMTYVTEEVGELAEAISEYEYRHGSNIDIVKECTQVLTLVAKIAEFFIDATENGYTKILEDADYIDTDSALISSEKIIIDECWVNEMLMQRKAYKGGRSDKILLEAGYEKCKLNPRYICLNSNNRIKIDCNMCAQMMASGIFVSYYAYANAGKFGERIKVPSGTRTCSDCVKSNTPTCPHNDDEKVLSCDDYIQRTVKL